MNSLNTAKILNDDSKVLKKAFGAAFLIEFIILTSLGIQQHWLAHPQKTTGLDSTKFIEAEVYQIPKESQLTEAKKISLPKAKEVTLSKKVDSGKKDPQMVTQKLNDQNQTQAGPIMAANHGPIAIVAPPPVIPAYLQDKDIKASVVIEFLVNNQGQATPRLIGSSGNEELDAIALNAVSKWQFRPAEQNHKPIDSKIRLRINFQVN